MLYNDDSHEQEFTHRIYGSDISPRAIDIATKNIKSAGVAKYIDLKIMPIQRYETAPSEQGILITNPPYGERISSSDLFGLYESIGNRLKHVFKGYDAWIISYHKECFDKIGLKPSVKIDLMNGALECEYRKYEIFDGRYKEFKEEGINGRDKLVEPICEAKLLSIEKGHTTATDEATKQNVSTDRENLRSAGIPNRENP